MSVTAGDCDANKFARNDIMYYFARNDIMRCRVKYMLDCHEPIGSRNDRFNIFSKNKIYKMCHYERTLVSVVI